MLVGQADRDNQMPGADVEGGVNQARDVELLQGDFATLLYFRLVFAVLGILQLVGRPSAARLELNLGAQYPSGIELIVERDDKTGNRNRDAVILVVPLRALETVDAVVHEVGQYLAISAHAESIIARGIDGLRTFGGSHPAVLFLRHRRGRGA